MNQTGTFTETLTNYTLTGTDNSGNAITSSVNPAAPSTGSVTIPADPTGGFDVTNTFTLNEQFTFNGSPEILDTPGTVTSAPIGTMVTIPTAVPEPASLAMLALSLVTFSFFRRRRGL